MTRKYNLRVAITAAAAALGLAYWMSGSAEAQDRFQDPDGPFTLSVPENWDRLETEAPFATFRVPDLDLTMHVLSLVT